MAVIAGQVSPGSCSRQLSCLYLRGERVQIGHEVLDRLERAQLQLHRQIIVAVDANLLGRLVHLVGVAHGADDKVVLLVGQRLRRPQPEAGGRAGDDDEAASADLQPTPDGRHLLLAVVELAALEFGRGVGTGHLADHLR